VAGSFFRCDEHLKNAKGYLGMTPIEAGERMAPAVLSKTRKRIDVVSDSSEGDGGQARPAYRCALEFENETVPIAGSRV